MNIHPIRFYPTEFYLQIEGAMDYILDDDLDARLGRESVDLDYHCQHLPHSLSVLSLHDTEHKWRGRESVGKIDEIRDAMLYAYEWYDILIDWLITYTSYQIHFDKS